MYPGATDHSLEATPPQKGRGLSIPPFDGADQEGEDAAEDLHLLQQIVLRLPVPLAHGYVEILTKLSEERERKRGRGREGEGGRERERGRRAVCTFVGHSHLPEYNDESSLERDGVHLFLEHHQGVLIGEEVT